MLNNLINLGLSSGKTIEEIDADVCSEYGVSEGTAIDYYNEYIKRPE